ncbi:MAG: hypothetical protein ACI8WB_003431 [Phenylobacterium sp.]
MIKAIEEVVKQQNQRMPDVPGYTEINISTETLVTVFGIEI